MIKKYKKKYLKTTLSNKNNQSISNEQMKSIRSSIQFATIKEIKSLIVASSESGAGKSFVSSNLAISFAEENKQVILVDADLRRPTIHKIFKKKNVKGIINVITGQNTLKECIQKTKYENLSILTSGFLPPNPAELLGSEEMKLFVDELKDKYDIVIFDTPPVLPVVDATLLSNFVDGVIFVVRSGYTDQNAAKKAVEKLKFTGCRIIGAILNGKNSKEKGYFSEYY